MSTGTVLEREWKHFFAGSYLFEDVYPGIQEEKRIGLEEGVDLFLSKPWRKILPSGLVQVKSSAAYALEFLSEGRNRTEVIPVVIGHPPKKETPEQVLRRLANDYCWHPRWQEKSQFAIRLVQLLIEFSESPQGLLLRKHRPRWALELN